MKELLDEVFAASVSWQEQLRAWLTEACPDDYSWQRPNRRHITGDNPIYLPSMYGQGAMRKLGVLLDQSGSVSDDWQRQFLGEVAEAVVEVKPGQLVVAYCDVKVHHSDVFDEPTSAIVAEKVKRHAHGGTNMVAGLTWFKRKHPDVQAVIVMTDGELFGGWGEQSDFPFPVLWAITNERYRSPWGENVYVKFSGKHGNH
jgi:predicted metal-dependent peptidase